MDELHKTKIAETKKGTKRMHNGSVNKMVSKEDIDTYIEKGWKLGSCRKQKYTKKPYEPNNSFEKLMLEWSKDK